MKLNTSIRKRFRVSNKVKRVASNDRFRLSISRSAKNISAQIIDDIKNVTLLSASSIEKDVKSGQKVNKILFFHDLIENFNDDNFSDKTDKELLLKDVNYQNFNDIKDEKVREIFINIKKRIDSDG